MCEPPSAGEDTEPALPICGKTTSSVTVEYAAKDLEPLQTSTVGYQDEGSVYVVDCSDELKNFVWLRVMPFLEELAMAHSEPREAIGAFDTWLRTRRINLVKQPRDWTVLLGVMIGITRAKNAMTFKIHFPHFPHPGWYWLFAIETR